MMSFTSYLKGSRVTTVVGARSPSDRRQRALKRVDKELSRGNYQTALSLVKQLKGKHGCLTAFGSAKLLPKKLEKTDLQCLIDSVLRSIESVYLEENSVKISKDEEKTSPEEDWFAVVQHESGHFLLGYLLGVLPRYYEIPTLEAVRQNVSSVTGRVEFFGFEFLKQVGAANELMKDDMDGGQMKLYDTQGNISSKTLNNFSCVILGGMVTEHLLFGYSEGFYSDVVMMNDVLRWVGFSKSEKEAHIKWAVYNSVSILHSYREARVSLAEAMAKAKRIGDCIEAIESAISRHQMSEREKV